MLRAEEVIGAIQASLERDTRVNVHANHIELSFSDGVITVTGEVDWIASKKIILEHAATPAPVAGVVDRAGGGGGGDEGRRFFRMGFNGGGLETAVATFRAVVVQGLLGAMDVGEHERRRRCLEMLLERIGLGQRSRHQQGLLQAACAGWKSGADGTEAGHGADQPEADRGAHAGHGDPAYDRSGIYAP